MPPDSGDQEDLDTRIRRAEQAVVARDARFAQDLAHLGDRVTRLRASRQWLLPAAGALLAVLVAWRLLRRGHGPSPATYVTRSVHDVAPAGSGWLGLAWPFLPARLKARINPSLLSAVMAITVPMVRNALRKPRVRSLRTVAHVDTARYAGTWYEIARLPLPDADECAGQPRATYTLHGPGLDVVNRCRTASGAERVARGVARVIPGSGGAKMKLSFLPPWLRWLPVGWADHWVLYLDPGYTVALVGEPTRRALWLLSRHPRIATPALRETLELARSQGFPVDQFVFSTPDKSHEPDE